MYEGVVDWHPVIVTEPAAHSRTIGRTNQRPNEIFFMAQLLFARNKELG
jgi:hypothetical protein